MNLKDEHTSRLWTFIIKGEPMKYKVYKKNDKGSYEQVEVTYNKEDLRKYIGMECQIIRYDEKRKTDDVLCKDEVEKEVGD